MSESLPYLFTLHIEEGVHSKMWLNELPIHKEPMRGPDSVHSGANHMLVPGRNKLAIEVTRMPAPPVPPPPPPPGTPAPKVVEEVPLAIKVYRVLQPNVEPIVASIVVEFELPKSLGLSRFEYPEMPFYREIEFDLPVPVTEPVFWRAPTTEFGCGGTPELVSAVLELHQALSRGDSQKFLELIRLRHESYSAAYPGEPSASVDRQRAAVLKFFESRISVKPLEIAKLHFEPLLGGRVASVTGWDDRPVLEAVADDHPGLALRANLLLTQHDGRWRIFG